MGGGSELIYEGLSAPELAARLRTPSCVPLARVTSALDVVHQLAGDGAPGKTLVLADEQVSGRGRHGRAWLSVAGQGILLGYLHVPQRAVESGVLSVRVGLAVLEALRALQTPDVGLKWPNDVLVRGRKVGGILCEGRWMHDRLRWIAVGIGVNVTGPLPEEVRDRGVALEEVVPGVRRIDVLDELVPRLHGLPVENVLSPAELHQFDAVDCLKGCVIVEPARGTADGIDRDGALLVATDHGVERVVAGSVRCS